MQARKPHHLGNDGEVLRCSWRCLHFSQFRANAHGEKLRSTEIRTMKTCDFCSAAKVWAMVLTLGASTTVVQAQSSNSESQQAMEERISRLEAEVAKLKTMVKQLLPQSLPVATSTQTGDGPSEEVPVVHKGESREA